MHKLDYSLDTHVKCDFCSSNDYLKIEYPERYGTSARMVICKKCGLGYLNPRWSKEAYANFYLEDYRNLFDKERRGNFRLLVEKQTILASRILRDCQPFIDTGCKVLDIGSSTGAALDFFKRYNDSGVFGVEPSESEVEYCRKTYGIEAFNGLFENFESDGEKFDVILLLQTLNHLLEPYQALQKIQKMLSADGIFYLIIQNFPEFSRIKRYPVKVDHTFYFNKETLFTMLNHAGLQPISLWADSKEWRQTISSDNRFPRIHLHVICRKSEPDTTYPTPDAIKIANRTKRSLKYQSRKAKLRFIHRIINALGRKTGFIE